jgi:hypothetical protein
MASTALKLSARMTALMHAAETPKHAKVRRQTRRRAIERIMHDALDRLCDGPRKGGGFQDLQWSAGNGRSPPQGTIDRPSAWPMVLKGVGITYLSATLPRRGVSEGDSRKRAL